MKTEKRIILSARVVSAIFNPLYLAFTSFCILFLFTYLSLLPWAFKLKTLIVVYFFTVLLPITLIHLYRRSKGWTLIELGQRERRLIPYLISIVSYLACYYLLETAHAPHFMGAIVATSLLIQVVCALVNTQWKVSTHTAAIGGMEGALVAMSFIFVFSALLWFCVLLIVGGLVGSARMLLRQHSLSQVVGGFLIGFVCGLLGMVYL